MSGDSRPLFIARGVWQTWRAAQAPQRDWAPTPGGGAEQGGSGLPRRVSTLVSPFYVQKGRSRSVAPSLRPVRAGRKRLSAPVHERVHVPGNSASVRVEPVATPAAPCAGPEPASNWSPVAVPPRSEDRRVGKEGVRACRIRWSP